jgi:hypothetical protein
MRRDFRRVTARRRGRGAPWRDLTEWRFIRLG